MHKLLLIIGCIVFAQFTRFYRRYSRLNWSQVRRNIQAMWYSMRVGRLQISRPILSMSVIAIVHLGSLNAQTNVPGPFSVNSVPVLDQTYISVTGGNTYVIAAGARVHGEYSFGLESSAGVQTVRLSVDANQFDPGSTLHILENHSYNGQVVMTNFRLLQGDGGVLVFLVVDVVNMTSTNNMYVQYFATSDYP